MQCHHCYCHLPCLSNISIVILISYNIVCGCFHEHQTKIGETISKKPIDPLDIENLLLWETNLAGV